MNVQVIEKNGKPEWAIIPYDEFEKLMELVGDKEDISSIEKNLADIKKGREIAIPGEVTFAILDGKHPIRAWREYKKLEVNEFAKKIGISSNLLSQIENGKQNPAIYTLKNIAKELDVDIDLLGS